MNQLTSSILYSIFVDNQNKNWIFSPASYLEAMSNLALCIKDQNLDELLAVAPNIADKQAEGLDTYNALFYSSEYREALNQAVIEAVKLKGGDLESFSDKSVVDRVNRIVREKTNGKIDALLTQEDITDFTKFIILNCIYFKKAWLRPFNEMWATEEFKGATKTSHVKFLHHKIEAGYAERYYEGVGYDIVELAYKESDVCCYLVVPTTASLFELFSDLSAHVGHIADVKAGMDVDLKVPPFKVESTFKELVEMTARAGCPSLFEYNKDWQLFNWSSLRGETLIKVEKIIQKAYLDFTKDGTEAAAATAIMGGISGCFFMPKKEPIVKVIRADKPFLYVLANRGDIKPLFVGIVNDVPDSPEGSPRLRKNVDGSVDLLRSLTGQKVEWVRTSGTT